MVLARWVVKVLMVVEYPPSCQLGEQLTAFLTLMRLGLRMGLRMGLMQGSKGGQSLVCQMDTEVQV